MANNGVNSSFQPLIPILKGENYHLWSIKMQTMFQSQDLWDIVENGHKEPVVAPEEPDQSLRESRKRNAKALFIIQSAVVDEIFPRISSSKTAKKAWEVLKQEYLADQKVMKDSSSSSKCEELEESIIKAAMDGNVKIFDEPNLSDEHFFRKTIQENNILHIALRYRQTKFVEAFLERYFGRNKKLISERNSHGDTPLHVTAEVGIRDIEDSQGNILLYGEAWRQKEKIVKLLCDYLEESVEEGEEEKPLRAQNSEGNTALHLAFLFDNDAVAYHLVKRDDGLARIVNDSREAPLHLAITHLGPFSDCNDYTKLLLKQERSVASLRDAKGLTPLLRAASRHPSDIVQVTKEIIDVCPESTLVCDASGKSFLHLLMLNNKLFERHPKERERQQDIENLICRKEIRILKDHQDKDGNTPLHLAAKSENKSMMTSMLSKCFPNPYITNRDGISAIMHTERRIMPRSAYHLACRGDIDSLQQTNMLMVEIDYLEFLSSQDSDTGSNFLHLLLSTTSIHHVFSSSNDHFRIRFSGFIENIISTHPQLLCEVDKLGNTPVHMLVQNKELADDPTATLWESALSSKLLPFCHGFTSVFGRVYNLELPWVKKNANGNTPLHEAIIAKNKVLVLQLLSYSEESAQLVNNNKETPLHLLAGIAIDEEEYTNEEIMKMVNANIKALQLPDKDGLTPISRAINAKNLQIVVTLLQSVQKFGDTDCQKSWHFILNHPSEKFFNDILRIEAFRNLLQQKDKDGNTSLHLAINKNSFVFVQVLLKHESFMGNQELMKLFGIKDKDGNTSLHLAINKNSFVFLQFLLKHESFMGNQVLMKLFSIPNNVGETPEDLLADLPIIAKDLEKTLLTDRRMRGIRSSWGIPRTQLQNYMSSMNVIAALQTTITFTAAFTVPGGLNQDIGTPILIQRISFQVFMISDVIAMCLSMMVLICLLWMVATNKRESVLIQDFALTLLLLSFIATLLTFMAGVYATIYPAKPWIAITTLVLCSLLMLFFPRRVLTKLLLHFKCPKVQIVKKMLTRPANSSNTQEQLP